MKFFEELYIGKSITDIEEDVSMLKRGESRFGLMCVCKNENGRFLYEILSSRELLKERNTDKYIVYGLAVGKREVFELLRYIMEDRHEY